MKIATLKLTLTKKITKCLDISIVDAINNKMQNSKLLICHIYLIFGTFFPENY